MIQVFCNKRGSGKTKRLIDLANSQSDVIKGNIVYIDDDSRPMYSLKREIRFITTKDFQLKDFESFYGYLCGILSGDYDIEQIYIDGLSNIISGNLPDAALLFSKLDKMSEQFNVNFFININEEAYEEIPEFIKKYVA
ncbi:hypothetical protein [Clostridium polynesiense]|uniref:hypothetical protein n=1 Tax=Clostridium polynesiense TaxID=1325933 RepID=UPI00058E918C|nr:hypothetical protein [Clostridium polynesiense]